jgi:single-strand DNA-binding protein
MSLNCVTLVGRVGGDPDVKYFESGSVKCRLTLAVNRRSKNNEQPDWFNLELWGKDAQFAADYIRKGRLIGVKGALKFDTWVDRATGAQRSSPVIRVERIELLDSKRDAEANAGAGYGNGGYEEAF